MSLFLTGLLFGSGPCLSSCGPVFLAYIAGSKKDIPKSIGAYILFSAARIGVYAGLSLAVFFLSKFALERLLGSFYRYVLVLGGGFIILMGLFLALGKRPWPHFWPSWYRNILERDQKSMLVMGLVVGLLPCAPLLSVLSYVGLISRTWLSSLLYAFFFGIGTFLSPLLLLTILAGIIPRFFAEGKEIYYRIFSFICGLAMVFLGLQLTRKAF